jgi:cytochrome c-type biogenesis protein CcmE
MTKGTQIALATLSIFAGIAWLLTRGEAGEGTFAYYSTVSEYVEHAQPASSGSARGDRVHGFVVEGSIPDMFMDGAEVVVEGHLGEKTFVAQKVLAKCPSKYEVEPGSEA